MAMNTITAVTAMAIKVGLISTEDCGLEVSAEVEEEDKISIDGSAVGYGEGAGFQRFCGIDAGAELRRSMAVFECKRLEMVGAVSPLLLTFESAFLQWNGGRICYVGAQIRFALSVPCVRGPF